MLINIAIITYKRPFLLERCIKSLIKSSKELPPILIFDNDPKQSAKEIKNKFPKLNIKYYVEETKGIPFVRNKVFLTSKSKYIVQLDDDCIVHKNWYKTVKNHIKNNKNYDFITGYTKLSNKNSLIARSQYNLYNKWFLNITKQKEISGELFDTKNIIIKNNFIKKHNLLFDTSFSNKYFSSNEDCDMGMQFLKHKARGLVDKKMIVFHPENPNLFKAIKKQYFKGYFKYIFLSKWDNEYNKNFLFSTTIKYIICVIKSIIKLNFKNSFMQTIELIFHIAYTLGYYESKRKK